MGTAIGVVGAGAWGTALAQSLALNGANVTIWAHEPETVASIRHRHVNDTYLPGIALAPSLEATGELADLGAAEIILLVPPAQHVRAVATALAPHVPAGRPVVVCAKGIEQRTGKLLSSVVADVLPEQVAAFLSGPSFAADVARGLPAALTLASADETAGMALAEALGSKRLRLYWTGDVTGVELGGAVKNVLAIAAGIVEGRGLGASAHAALVARGFAELRRLGEAMGARPETLMGLAGLGDLILTCGSPQSRNMSLGRALGQGRALADVLGERRAVTEGVFTAAALAQVADELGVDMPISQAVHHIVGGRLTVEAAIEGLMSRPQKAEG
ncbi:MAG: NAD(P)H-dependent glycerol-3-phosphate dehydrogenase [Hyphomicrobiaceae bacterium]|nr:NAD(P)H-dependent glycerol-3-phosphate dehydrogenase [Hyphomicrobiaceae bacterium]